ncbi:hypothetical protein [Pseudogemmobacter blasticus]|uniref:Uncharacterized protein n=1 Tax=Fuscovulum blasticum DSM 2131 TaxID=1188250 RepID=A0A2T4J8S0_FUSBL|nr:hypothetical protein [Fuscovulum blasticum]AWD21163.1 hypothetical protein B6K69_05320 [Fuscovulum blasticum]PTE14310.1 hypothetical protein C5F44_09945 [Fuscovulum blasticum DSM 2131]
MADDLPDYYFRLRDNGAAVYKVDTENRQRRIELIEIAMVNVRNGNVKPHGETKLNGTDIRAIQDWLGKRRILIEAREVDDVLRTGDRLNEAAQWAQSKATPEQLDEVTETLLLAMHDLRSVLVRKKAERLTKAPAGR